MLKQVIYWLKVEVRRRRRRIFRTSEEFVEHSTLL